jgi:1-acyl-sn-glycerol-3-phosphate acyltransferase
VKDQHTTLVVNRPREVNIVLHLIGRFYFWLRGWRVTGEIPADPKMIVVAGPHTANMDGILLILTSWVVRVKLYWITKVEVTRAPVLGWLARAAGGVGIDRSRSFNTVTQVVEELERRERLLLAVAPEGTRKKLDHWKTGFYWMARKADARILCGRLDYKLKVVDLAEAITTTGDIESDMERIFDLYRDVNALHPEKVNDMRLRPSQLHEPS